MILVDTNVFVRLCRKDDPDNTSAHRSLILCGRIGTRVVVPQNLFEFWVVATRPVEQNGLGMDVTRAAKWVSHIRRTCRVMPDPPELLNEWQRLVEQHKTLGKAAHDARLVAAMSIHGIKSILTFNASHFVRYGITVVDARTL
jgi:predicted nucleic acid-binding protein